MVNVLSELFHVSDGPRVLDWAPSMKPKTWPDAKQEADETAIDAQRPPDAPSRRASYFAFGSLAECVLYADSMKFADPHYYRVRLIQARRAPMTLTYVPEDLQEYRDAIFREYWNADDGWSIYEYFSPQMIVRSKVDEELADPGPALAKLLGDRNRLRELASTWV